jgi:hypothetical protein
VLIITADTGLRENEVFTLEKSDIDFGRGVINVRAINAKTKASLKIGISGQEMTAQMAIFFSKVTVGSDKSAFFFLDFAATGAQGNESSPYSDMHKDLT